MSVQLTSGARTWERVAAHVEGEERDLAVTALPGPRGTGDAPPAVVPTARASGWRDLFRWVAALAVVADHVVSRLQTSLEATPVRERPFLANVSNFLAGFSHEAVMVFFVLSGFLVGGSLLLEARATGDVDLRAYFTKRLVRLYVVVLPALLLGYLFDQAGIMVTTGGPEVYPPPVRAAHAPSVLLCNAVFLQTIRCAPAGSNVALWSLANEFWYYVLWPLLLAPWLVRRPRRERAALLALGVGIAAWLTTAEHSGALFVLYMVVWLIDVVPFVVRGPWLGATPRRTALLFVALLIAIRIGVRLDLEADPWRVFALDLGVALAFANVLASLRSDHATRLLPGSAWHRSAAEFSYSLYAVHVPIVTFASALLASGFGIGWHMPPSGVLVYVLSVAYVAGAIVCGWAFARMTEAHTTAVRRRVARLLVRRPS